MSAIEITMIAYAAIGFGVATGLWKCVWERRVQTMDSPYASAEDIGIFVLFASVWPVVIGVWMVEYWREKTLEKRRGQAESSVENIGYTNGAGHGWTGSSAKNKGVFDETARNGVEKHWGKGRKSE